MPAQHILTPEEIARRCHAVSPALGRRWQVVINLAESVRHNHGVAYLVGGAVRDLLLGFVPEDFDIEIHGLSAETVEEIVRRHGQTSSVGRSYGVLKLHCEGRDIDVALPRHDTKTGAGHRDFSVGIDPHMGIAAAAERRDFTIGAIYGEILTGALHDPFGGIVDLQNKTLRVVHPKKFVEDPLRLLRALQLAARFELTAEPATMLILRELVAEMGVLSRERIHGEWLKILQAKHVSLGLQLGRSTGYFEAWLPELSALWNTPQPPRAHPEGSVWDHSLLVVDEIPAVAKRFDISPDRYPLVVLAGLLHDVGKSITTRHTASGFDAPQHAQAGIEPTRAVLSRLGFQDREIRVVVALVAHHQHPHQLYGLTLHGQSPTVGQLRRLQRELEPATLSEVLTLAIANTLGRGPFTQPDGLVAMPSSDPAENWWRKKIDDEKLNEPLEPILTGRDLVERNWPTGPLIGEAVHLADQLGLHGFSRAEVLHILDSITTPSDVVSSLRDLVQAEGA